MRAMKSPLIQFYRGKDTNQNRQHWDDIHHMDDFELEHNHTYIQWLFPLLERSRAVPSSPVLSDDDVVEFCSDPELKERLKVSLDLMLKFYGLQRADNMIVPSSEFAIKSKNWVRRGDHNHLRLTRIMKSLSLLGLETDAKMLQTCLLKIAEANPQDISPSTVSYWKGAVR